MTVDASTSGLGLQIASTFLEHIYEMALQRFQRIQT